MKWLIIIAVCLVIVGGFLFWKFGPSKTTPTLSGPVTLIYWGFEDEKAVKVLIAEYQKKHPKVSISYVKQSPTNYRTRVQTKIREGIEPDILEIHSSWLGMFEGDLAPALNLGVDEYKQNFYPVAAESFIKNNQVLAAPLEIDGLGLIYNEDILTPVGAGVPKSWAELVDVSNKVTVKDSSGVIKTSGAALGATTNIDAWSDILGLLLLQQPGVDLLSPASSPATEVFRFYTSFITDPKKKSWDVNLSTSTQMFTSGNLAFYFGSSQKIAQIKQANPNLKFKVAPVPQLPGRNVAWASFWAVAVSNKSPHTKEAWGFAKFLTSAEGEKLYNSTAASMNLSQRPYARVELAGEQTNDPYLGAYVTQGPYYKSWFLNSNTFDNGINDEMIKLWEDGLNSTLQGTDPLQALQKIAQGVKPILDKYNSK